MILPKAFNDFFLIVSINSFKVFSFKMIPGTSVICFCLLGEICKGVKPNGITIIKKGLERQKKADYIFIKMGKTSFSPVLDDFRGEILFRWNKIPAVSN